MVDDDHERTTDETAAEDAEQVLEEIERKRSLRGMALLAVAAVGITFSLFQLWIAARGFTFEATIPGIGTYRLISL